MQKILSFFISLVFLLLTACSTSEVKVSYDNTNPVKIEEATKGLDLLQLLPNADTIKGMIAIKSIERGINEPLDESTLHMIEDNLISILINNGYRILERDPDALGSLYRESSENYKANENTPFLDTNLNSADYIFSYRVIECGIIYAEIDEAQKALIPDFSTLDNIARSARTRLHCRLIDAKTSEIIAAGLIENEIIDIIDRNDINNLKSISYDYYDYTMPLQDENESRRKEDTYKNSETHMGKIKKFTTGVLISIFSVLGGMLISN